MSTDDRFRDHDSPVLMGADDGHSPPLTDVDHELLYSALEQGYFDVPRRISLVELAGDNGLTDREAMYRMQKGISALLTEILVEGSDGGERD